MSDMHIAFHPFAICAFIAFGIFAWICIRTKPDLPTFIGAINSIGSSPTAITVMIIGCVMLVMCKQYGLDSTIAGGIIGVASNMLTTQFTKSHTDSTGTATSDTSTIPGPTTTNSSTPATNQVGTPNEPPSPPTISTTP